MRYVILFCLFLSSCSNAPTVNFFRDTTGEFTINLDGALFFALYFPGSTFKDGDTFTVDNAGNWNVEATTYLSVHEVKTDTRAVYKFNANNKFFGMILEAKRNIMVTTNLNTRPEDVDFTFSVPIAVKK